MAGENDFFIAFNSNIEDEAQQILTNLRVVNDALDTFEGRVRDFEIRLNLDPKDVELITRLNSTGDINIRFDGNDLRQTLSNALATAAGQFGEAVARSFSASLRGTQQSGQVSGEVKVPTKLTEQLSSFSSGLTTASSALGEFVSNLASANIRLSEGVIAAATSAQAGSAQARQQQPTPLTKDESEETARIVSNFGKSVQNLVLQFEQFRSSLGAKFTVSGEEGSIGGLPTAKDITDALKSVAGDDAEGTFDEATFARVVAAAFRNSLTDITLTAGSKVGTAAIEASAGAVEAALTKIITAARAGRPEQGIPGISDFDLPVQSILGEFQSLLGSIDLPPVVDDYREGAEAARTAAEGHKASASAAKDAAQAEERLGNSAEELIQDFGKISSTLNSLGQDLRGLRSESFVGEDLRRAFTEGRGGAHSTRASNQDILIALLSRVSSTGTETDAANRAPRSVTEGDDPLVMAALRRQEADRLTRQGQETSPFEITDAYIRERLNSIGEDGRPLLSLSKNMEDLVLRMRALMTGMGTNLRAGGELGMGIRQTPFEGFSQRSLETIANESIIDSLVSAVNRLTPGEGLPAGERQAGALAVQVAQDLIRDAREESIRVASRGGEDDAFDPNIAAREFVRQMEGLRHLLRDLTGLDIDALGRASQDPNEAIPPEAVQQLIAVLRQLGQGNTGLGETGGSLTGSLQVISRIMGGRRSLARNVTIPRDADDPLLRASRDEAFSEIARLASIQERESQAITTLVQAIRSQPGLATDQDALGLKRLLGEAQGALGFGATNFEDFLAALTHRLRIEADTTSRRTDLDDTTMRSVLGELRTSISAVGEFRDRTVAENQRRRDEQFESTSGMSAARGYDTAFEELLRMDVSDATITQNALRGFLAERFQGSFAGVPTETIELAEQAGIGGIGDLSEQAREYNDTRRRLIDRVSELLIESKTALDVLDDTYNVELRKLEADPSASSADDFIALRKRIDAEKAEVRARTRAATEQVLFPTAEDIRFDPTLQTGPTQGGLQGLVEGRADLLTRVDVTLAEEIALLQENLEFQRRSGATQREIAKAERALLDLKKIQEAKERELIEEATTRKREGLREGRGFGVPTAVDAQGGVRADATKFILDAISTGQPVRDRTTAEDTSLGRPRELTGQISELIQAQLESQRREASAIKALENFLATRGQPGFIKGELASTTEDESELRAAVASARGATDRLGEQISSRLSEGRRDEALELVRALRQGVFERDLTDAPQEVQDRAERELNRIHELLRNFLTADRRRALGVAEGEQPELNPRFLAAMEKLLQFETAMAALRTGHTDVVGALPRISAAKEEELRQQVTGALGDDFTPDDFARVMNQVLGPLLDRGFLTGQRRSLDEEVGPVVPRQRIDEGEVKVDEAQVLKQQREASASLHRAAKALESSSEETVLRDLATAIRELVECCKAMRGLVKGEGGPVGTSAFDTEFVNQAVGRIVPDAMNQQAVTQLISSLASATVGGKYAYKPEQIADLTRGQFGSDVIGDDKAFKAQIDAVRRLGEESKKAATSQGRLAREGVQAAEQTESSWHRAQGAINQTFGAGGVISKAFNFIGLFVSREIAGALVFSITSAARRVGQEILEIQDQIVRVEQALDALGEDPAGIRGGLSGVSNDLAIPLSDISSTAASLVGVFEDASQVEFATNVVGQLEKISNGALNAKEGFRSIQAIVTAFEIEGAAGLQQVADIATQIQNLTSVNVEDTVEGISNIAEQARSLNLSIQETGVLLALVARGTGSTGDAAAEKLGRLLSGFQDPAKIGLLRNLELEDGTKAIDDQLITSREYGQVLAQLAQQWENITQAQRDQVSAAFGSRREAAVFQAIVGQGDELGELIGRVVDSSAGAAERRVQVLLENLNGQIQRLGVQFTNLIASIADLGLVTPLTTLLGTFNDILGAITAIVDGVSKISETVPGVGTAIELGSTLASVLVLSRLLPKIATAVGEFTLAYNVGTASQVAQTSRGVFGATTLASTAAAAAPLAPVRVRGGFKDPVTGQFVSPPPTFAGRNQQGTPLFRGKGGQFVSPPAYADDLLKRQAAEQAASMTRLQRAMGRTGQAVTGMRSGLGNLGRTMSGMFAMFPGGIAGLATLTAGLVLWNKTMDAAARSQDELNTVLQHYGLETRDQVKERLEEKQIDEGKPILDLLDEGKGIEDRVLDRVIAGFQGVTRGRGAIGGTGALLEATVNEFLRGLAGPDTDIDPLGVRTDAQTNIDTAADAVRAFQANYNEGLSELTRQFEAGELTPDEFAKETAALQQRVNQGVSESLASQDITDATYRLLSDRMGRFLQSGQDFVTGQLAGQAELIAAVQLDKEQVAAITQVRDLLAGSSRGFREEYAEDIATAIEATGLHEDSVILKHLNDMNEAEGAVASAQSALRSALATREGVLASAANFQGVDGETWEEALLNASKDVESALQNLIDVVVAMGNASADFSERFGDYESAAAHLNGAQEALKGRLSRLDQGTPEFLDTLTQILDTQARIADLAIQGTQNSLQIFQALTDNQIDSAEAEIIAAEQRYQTALENAGAFSQEEITSRFIDTIEANTSLLEAQVSAGFLTEVDAEIQKAKYKRDQLVELIRTANVDQQRAFAAAVTEGLSLPEALAQSGIDISPGDSGEQIKSLLGNIDSKGQTTVDVLNSINAALRGTLSVRFPGGLINLVLGRTPRPGTSYSNAQRSGPSGIDNIVADQQGSTTRSGPDDVNAFARQAIQDAQAAQAEVAAVNAALSAPQLQPSNFQPQGDASALAQAAEEAAKAAEEAEQKAEQLRQAIAATESARLRDPVLRAQRELTEAMRRVAYTRGRDAIEHQQALQAEIQARQTLADAIQAQVQAQFALDEAIASAAGDVIRVAELQLDAARQRVKFAQEQFGHGSAEHLNAQAAEIQAQAGLRDTELGFRLETLEFEREMGIITNAEYIAGLEALAKNQDLTLAQARDLQRKLKAARDSINDALSPGFNIPDEINVPTAYQVRANLGLPTGRRSGASAGTSINNSGWNFNTSIQNNITQVMTEGQMRQLMANIERNVAQAVDRGVRSGSGGLVPLS